MRANTETSRSSAEAGASTTMSIDSFCACPPMMQCLHDIDRQRSCARSDSRHRQRAPRGASCLSFFYRIFILYVNLGAEVFHSTLVVDIR